MTDLYFAFLGILIGEIYFERSWPQGIPPAPKLGPPVPATPAEPNKNSNGPKEKKKTQDKNQAKGKPKHNGNGQKDSNDRPVRREPVMQRQMEAIIEKHRSRRPEIDPELLSSVEALLGKSTITKPKK